MFAHPLPPDAELRLLERRHAEALFALTDTSRHHLRRWLPWVDHVTHIDDSRAFIHKSLRQFARGDGFQAGIWHNGNLAGVIGFHSINQPNRSCSLGYWLGESFQGHGLMTRACQALVDHALHDLQLHRVEIRCAEQNLPSRKIPERLGFLSEGLLRDAENLHDRRVDHRIYSMLAPDWPASSHPS